MVFFILCYSFLEVIKDSCYEGFLEFSSDGILEIKLDLFLHVIVVNSLEFFACNPKIVFSVAVNEG